MKNCSGVGRVSNDPEAAFLYLQAAVSQSDHEWLLTTMVVGHISVKYMK